MVLVVDGKTGLLKHGGREGWELLVLVWEGDVTKFVRGVSIQEVKFVTVPEEKLGTKVQDLPVLIALAVAMWWFGEGRRVWVVSVCVSVAEKRIKYVWEMGWGMDRKINVSNTRWC